MLYEDDDKNEKNSLVLCVKNNKNNIYGIIIIVCIIVMIISIVFSIKMKKSEISTSDVNYNTVQDDNTTEKNVIAIYSGEHLQIPRHNVEVLKVNDILPKPNPNAQEEIKNIYYSEERVVYLTFDDGPSRDVTPQILDILKQEQVPATFFVLGSRVELHPELVKREFDEGHYIANHGYSHEYSQIYTSRDTVFEEYAKTENVIRNALGIPDYNSYLFRFPGGSSGGRYAAVKAEAKDLLLSYGIANTNWNCLTGDAEGKNTAEKSFDYFLQTMQGHGGLIVLMHDANDKTYTVEALPSVISYLKEQGYTFKNFYEIFK